ncbi:MAG: 30S ribosomal protein S1 [Anaerolineae bacterium]
MQGEEANAGSGKPQQAQDEAVTTMAELMERDYLFQEAKRGDFVRGTIVSISDSEILIDIGAKSEGVVGGQDLDRLDRDYLASLNVGDEVPAFVVKSDDENGNIILSLSRALVEKDWEDAQALFESGQNIEGEVSGYNKGGLIVNFGRIRGFVPGSQVFTPVPGGGKADRWKPLVGQQLRLKIIEIDRRRNRLIFSERVAMEEWRQVQKEKLLDSLSVGETRRGQVSRLTGFGAFVDLGGADGLIHLSELSWARVAHPREVLQVGDEVDVYVLNVDHERQRIALSLKRLQPEPWSGVLDRYQVGDIVEAVITKLADFGAFARLEDNIEGLIHISELSEKNIAHPREVVQDGQQVSVRIIRIDPERRRMGLSLKQAEGEADWEEYVDSPAETSSEDELEVDVDDAVTDEDDVTVESADVTADKELQEA